MKNYCKTRKSVFYLMFFVLAFFLCQDSYADNKKKKKGETEQMAQDYGKTVSLITTGTGATKELATQNALRAAIEKTFGTFVSANSAVVNDDLVKDEIVTVTSGNIKSFEELNCTQVNGSDGILYEVTVQAEVSIDNLVSFAQNHGMSAELAGQTFAMNVKLDALNAANENEALSNLVIQLYKIAKQGLYDFKIDVKEPSMEDGLAVVEAYVLAIPNGNYKAYTELAKKTISSLSNMSTGNGFSFGWQDKKISERTGSVVNEDFFTQGKGNFHLRNNINEFHSVPGNELAELGNGANFIYWYERFKYLSRFAFGIQDNIGHRIITIKKPDELQVMSYTASAEPKVYRRKGIKEEYDDFDCKVLEGKFSKLGKRYDLQRGYAGYNDYISALFSLGYTLADVSKLSKIDVFPNDIDLIDNELLMDIIISNPDPNKLIEEGNHLLDLADGEQGEKRIEYFKMADRKFEMFELMGPILMNVSDELRQIKKIRKQIKEIIKEN